MFFVFDVDQAVQYNLSIALHARSVKDLMVAIENHCNVEVDNQIIMASGGVKLSDPDQQLVEYRTGTESNPVFLYRQHKKNKEIMSSNLLCNPYTEPVTHIKRNIDEVWRCTGPKQQTYAFCILDNISVNSNKLLQDMVNLVRDVSYQQQGWYTLLAHHTDSLGSFQKTFENFKEAFAAFVEDEKKNIELLDSVPEHTSLLSKIPVSLRIFESVQKLDLISSRSQAARGSGRRSRTASESSVTSAGPAVWTPVERRGKEPSGGATTERRGKEGSGGTPQERRGKDGSKEGRKKRESDGDMPVMFEFEEDLHDDEADTEKSLLQWMKESSVKDISFYTDACLQGLTSMNEANYQSLLKEYTDLVNCCKDPYIISIPGMPARISSVHHVLDDVRATVEELKRDYEGQRANRGKLSSHQCRELLSNLRAYADRLQHAATLYDTVARTKFDMNESFYKFTSAVMELLDKLHKRQSYMQLTLGNLDHTTKYLQIVRNVVAAPGLFCLSIAEIMRRNAYSAAFKRWSEPLLQQTAQIHSCEVDRRSVYRKTLDQHFLTSLFPGLVENPPSHWGKRPRDFDLNVPQLSRDYLHRLAAVAPEYRALLLQEVAVEAVPALLQQVTTVQTAGRETHESETDTEDFEKVGRSDGLEYQGEVPDAYIPRPLTASSPDSTQEYITAEFDFADQSDQAQQTSSLGSGNNSREDMASTLQVEEKESQDEQRSELATLQTRFKLLTDAVTLQDVTCDDDQICLVREEVSRLQQRAVEAAVLEQRVASNAQLETERQKLSQEFSATLALREAELKQVEQTRRDQLESLLQAQLDERLCGERTLHQQLQEEATAAAAAQLAEATAAAAARYEEQLAHRTQQLQEEIASKLKDTHEAALSDKIAKLKTKQQHELKRELENCRLNNELQVLELINRSKASEDERTVEVNAMLKEQTDRFHKEKQELLLNMKALDDSIATITDQKDAIVSELQEKVAAMEEQQQTMTVQFATELQAEATNAKHLAGEIRQQIATIMQLEEEIQAQAATIKNCGSERKTLIEVKEDAMEKFNESLQEMEDLRAEHRERLRYIAIQHKEEICSFVAEQEASIADHKEEICSLVDNHETSIAEHKHEICSLVAKYEASIAEHNDELLSLTTKHENVMAAMAKQHSQELVTQFESGGLLFGTNLSRRLAVASGDQSGDSGHLQGTKCEGLADKIVATVSEDKELLLKKNELINVRLETEWNKRQEAEQGHQKELLRLAEDKRKDFTARQAEVARVSRQLTLDKERVLEERDLQILVLQDKHEKLAGLVTEVDSYRSQVVSLTRQVEELRQELSRPPSRVLPTSDQQTFGAVPQMSSSPLGSTPPQHTPSSPHNTPSSPRHIPPCKYTHSSPHTSPQHTPSSPRQIPSSPPRHIPGSHHTSPQHTPTSQHTSYSQPTSASPQRIPSYSLQTSTIVSQLTTSIVMDEHLSSDETASVSTASSKVVATTLSDASQDVSCSFMSLPPSSSTGQQAGAVAPSPVKRGYSLLVQVGSCQPGDLCLLLWDSYHRQYRFVLQSNVLHFLHQDCFGALGLDDMDGAVTPLVAHVLHKEFCIAKRTGNRFRVPPETKFYRVYVRLPDFLRKQFPVTGSSVAPTPAACVLHYMKMLQPWPLVLADVALKDLVALQRVQLERLRQNVEKMEATGAAEVPCTPMRCDATGKLRKRKPKRKSSSKQEQSPGKDEPAASRDDQASGRDDHAASRDDQASSRDDQPPSKDEQAASRDHQGSSKDGQVSRQDDRESSTGDQPSLDDAEAPAQPTKQDD